MRRRDVGRVALRIARALGEREYLLVGGLAVAAHGYPRATSDVDFVVRSSLSEVGRRLGAHGIPSSLRRGDVREGDFPCLRGTLDGVGFDILPPLVDLDWERAIKVPVGQGTSLNVVDLDGLLRLKFRARGPQDLLDAAVLALRNPGSLDRAREMASAYRVRDRFDSFLASPRTRATADEARRREEGHGGVRRSRRPPARPSGPKRS